MLVPTPSPTNSSDRTGGFQAARGWRRRPVWERFCALPNTRARRRSSDRTFLAEKSEVLVPTPAAVQKEVLQNKALS